MALMGIEAARQGQGVVLTSALLVEEELANGSLVEPFSCRLALDVGYYVVHRRGADLPPAARQLAQWLLSNS
jgi:LysR family glycine cleavage system transcriptional activator